MADAALDAVLAPAIIHLGGTGLLAKLDGAPSARLLAEAKRRGRTVTFDLLGAGPQTLSLIEPLLPHIDYFMPSIEEARDISGAADVPSAAGFFLGRGVKHCVFTLGGDGACFVAASGENRSQPAYMRSMSWTRQAAATHSTPASSPRSTTVWMSPRARLCPSLSRAGGDGPRFRRWHPLVR